MSGDFPILQIVGYQNSGKTTFMELLIKRLAHQNMKVGCLKHHGHGGEPASATKGKDTNRYLEAGSVISGVEGGGVFQLTARGNLLLEQLIPIYELLSIDCLLIEGFKQAAYQKIVMVRDEKDKHLLQQLEGIIAVIYRDQKPQLSRLAFPVFHIKDPSAISFIFNYLKEEGACRNDLT
ncbi:molybdopterin-guanine dinucleotide biosynthesis protein B [Bacillus changyiensis]|uniref:molybdopterin-guanine dinucleotide biosynthesis protein B n=1 Tax=Bacillus changyiensis TaxID=3004103 RepID=UPI0022E1C381|nr:molybdopterin-guanine dinucleotide biosynthesis protein B [Bacillus changyiensis]MDA1475728.1 molybdopterin-guanine dinucleotide biosynthesis protein B [Bacillus changyiensis]